MAKVFTGIVTSNKMQQSIVVEVTRRTPHPLYKKLMKKSKKFLVDSGQDTYEIGQTVKIVETKPISKNKHFKVLKEKK